LIERAYTQAEAMGVAVWCEDEAGPYQTVPYPGASWQPEGEPLRQPHEYFQERTAKMLTLFHPATGQLRVKGTSSTRNAILHPWLKTELTRILAELPPSVARGHSCPLGKLAGGFVPEGDLVYRSAAFASVVGYGQFDWT